MEETNQNEKIFHLWGKTGSVSLEYHPAVYHMLDVGHVAQYLLGEKVSSRWLTVLSQSLNTDSATLSHWLPWFIALHDIGKISVSFQNQNEEQRNRLIEEGFGFGNWRPSLNIPHTLVGQVFSEKELNQMNNFSLPERLSVTLREAIGGHHGKFVSASERKDARNGIQVYEATEWMEMRSIAATILYRYFIGDKNIDWPSPKNISTAIALLTGFTILCDWLGSDSSYFAPRSQVAYGGYLEESKDRANKSVEMAGFFQCSKSEAPSRFMELFKDKLPPRPLQMEIDLIPEELLTQPCLVVIEAPTGEGKTEAALALAHRLAKSQGCDDLYCALPTTATSNQMFGRLQEHLSQRLGLGTRVKLVHGQAFLVEDDLSIQPLNDCDESDHKPVLEWFSPKKRSLLAPFGVGTIDQAELVALNVKHGTLRMLGLAGKVVIIDEVHAYDTYMTTIIERLLQWLAAIGTSVILLSATLQQSRRNALMAAYGSILDIWEMEEINAYPIIWVSSRAGNHFATPMSHQPERKIELHHLGFQDDDFQGKSEWLLDKIEDGGCVCWITNTVERAQRLFEFIDKSANYDTDRILLHACFPLEQRQKIEKELNGKYGPQLVRPKRGIVIGTQVLEQSLDLDFDLMVSDLAPVDLLLQRAGRMHRHNRMRPRRHDIPRLWIAAELDKDGAPKMKIDSLIYEEYFLRKTWLLMKNLKVINLPGDYRSLIESVYGNDEPGLVSPLQSSWDTLQKHQTLAIQEAELRLLAEPDPDWPFTSEAARMQFEEDEDSSAWIVAQTRLGRESISLIPLERDGEHVFCPGVDGILDINIPASREIQLQLLRHSLKTSNHLAVVAIKQTKSSLPALFTQSALLKGYFPLWLMNGKSQFPMDNVMLRMTLDSRLGLVIRKEGAK